MWETVMKRLTGVPMTAASGVLLALDFVLTRCGVKVPVTPAVGTLIISGVPIAYAAVRKLCHNRGIKRISSALLITVATVAAVGIGDVFAAGEVVFLMAVGELLEDITTDRAKRGLTRLFSLSPTRGRRIQDETEVWVDATDIAEGDIFRVLAGEVIPTDGVIVRGDTAVDQSILTGESVPVDKTVGDTVYGGTVNQYGVMELRATDVGECSALGRLIRLVERAEHSKSPVARMADTAAAWLVPTALLAAIVTGIVTADIIRAVTVLVVFCPCAMVLATPTATMAAIGNATKRGVIIKSGEVLERLGKADTVALDKTGTLTHGVLSVSCITVADTRYGEQDILRFAAAAEVYSEHPLGKAIVAYARDCEIDFPAADDFRMQAGRGIAAVVEGHPVLCGNREWIAEHRISLPKQTTDTAMFVAVDGVCYGYIVLSDTVRSDAADTVRALRSLHVTPLLLTGDNDRSAQAVAHAVGITDVCAALLPAQKAAHITARQAAGHVVCMVGDGINDAPALRVADVGIAMGAMGSDMAVEAADIALMTDEITALPYLKRLANATRRTTLWGIGLSVAINILAVIFSALGWLNPTAGALIHNAGSVLIILMAALLYDRKL